MAIERGQGRECEAEHRCQFRRLVWEPNEDKLTIAPILPLVVITRPIKVLPRTQAPMANLQLRPTAIIEEAVLNDQRCAFVSKYIIMTYQLPNLIRPKHRPSNMQDTPLCPKCALKEEWDRSQRWKCWKWQRNCWLPETQQG